MHVNLIPFNSFIGSNLEGTSEENCSIFSNKLKIKGFQSRLDVLLGLILWLLAAS